MLVCDVRGHHFFSSTYCYKWCLFVTSALLLDHHFFCFCKCIFSRCLPSYKVIFACRCNVQKGTSAPAMKFNFCLAVAKLIIFLSWLIVISNKVYQLLYLHLHLIQKFLCMMLALLQGHLFLFITSYKLAPLYCPGCYTAIQQWLYRSFFSASFS